MKSSVEHKISSLLTKEENEQIFRLFGQKCQSLATSVVQLFLTQSPDHSHWIKQDTGVMCFIKDNVRRNYFFRLYCLNRSKMIWEQELYNNFEYKTSHDYFHMFEIDDCIAGINFASEDDALSMKAVVIDKLTIKRQRREERKSRNSLQNRSSIQPNQGLSKPPAFNSNLALSNDKLQYNQSNNISYSNVTQSSKNKKKRIFTKEDIGLPQNFIHISHVGWDPNKGFDINVEDPNLKQFFSKAGVSDRQLRDKDTRDFIYDFINTHGGLDAVKSEVITDVRVKKSPYPPPPSSNHIPPTPPPVPARTPVNYLQRSAPPPPPPNKVVKPPPPVARGMPPPRPDPIQNVPIPEPPRMNNASIPPPPLPPMSDFTAPPPPSLPSFPSAPSQPAPAAAPDPRSALLESIRAGRNLKPVENVERKPSVGDSRGDLLSEIRQGIELKPVQNNQRPSSGPSCEENTLAEALSNALKARAFAIHSDSESDSGNSTDDEDEWEQDD